ncbi:Midasin [Venustampulla echinocandica]|uniref:Midasin n=1 Tax=Venustampulla echinocandica TaxID=2656787 RepID=A0A370TPD9_9HELO|nr:Midasin [Venustampulla echinocandica]RDL37384.1 Midasin [Venustampulla echinocandica]
MDIDLPDKGQNSVPQVSGSLEDLPEEILEILRLQKSPQFLEVLATAALKPKLTIELFIRFHSVFADCCARWISNCEAGKQNNEIIEAFARILPLAPHLVTYLDKYLRDTSTTIGSAPDTDGIHSLSAGNASGTELSALQTLRVLLATFRLLNFDRYKFLRKISGARIQSLFHHGDRAVQYLAVRVFCQLLSASDSKLEAMINQHVGEDAVMGDCDGDTVDYGFLGLFEAKMLKDAQNSVSNAPQDTPHTVLTLHSKSLSPLVVRYGSVLLPRPNGPPSQPTSLVQTATTSKNMECFATSLLSSSPILLHGLAGSGKTSLVTDFARELGVESTMVSLHLNEQTDAKMLIGMYATGSTPGSFTWRAGVLTTAVREGRWVFIEDLDRAPNEVISVILPLIERGELLIPSRGETIKAGPGFRLLASIRTSLSVTGQENAPALHMLGARLWQRVPVQMPSQDEFREIIAGSHPILDRFLPGIISVYERLYTLSQKPAFASRSRTSLGRPISPRDLLKWCRRLDNVLLEAGSKTGNEPITESNKYDMFLEASDCFAGSLQTEEARKAVVMCIAEEMYIDPQRVEHYLTAHVPRYDATESHLNIGRAHLPKRNISRAKSSGKPRPFAKTAHAKRLLEQVGVAVKMAEPVLLVGETGIGKTTVVQQLADSLGLKLTAVNLSQQSEVGDLLGGFKPVNVRTLAIPLKDEFDELFAATGISVSKNQRYIDQLGKSVAKSQWSKASKLWHEAPKMFNKILSELQKRESNTRSDAEQPMKRRKTESRVQSLLHLKPRWERFSESLDQFDVQLSGGSKGFAFTFVEGNIVKAARNGDWVLLDEINLASPDTLESIADLLRGGPDENPSILLSETGEIERVQAHPNFRIFGAMNPATDVGKRDLPMGLRSRFTEIYVESPDRDLDDLLSVITTYLRGTSTNDTRAAHDVARLYLNTKRLADEKRLVDGASQVPHFSLRTLTRVLTYVNDIAPSYGLRRALYEGFAMGFLTLLNRDSEKLLIPLINHHLLDTHGNPQSLLAQTPRHPDDGRQYVRFMNKKKDRQYWMLQGSEIPQEQPHYIITPFVERNLLNLVRATSTRRFPVLVQGPTSSGKTSMIEYLAKFSGNKFVRINNHEHTDLQEYLGTYISGSDGKLRFQEGLLVQALRQGHWIVLDELNLAPTDVLEALNRLLDDNRELLIPETQEVVRPHENFMLFATQNPPGLYGGRKTLSRAFRNRFLELHFDDIPEDELEFILEKRTQKVAPSDCRRIVTVYKELSRLRQSSRLFEQKDSFATLRDLFRWALRDADNREQLAANGYMLLAERVRNPEERIAVKEIIEKVMKVKLDPNDLYDATHSSEIKAYDATSNALGVVWTHAMRRLYVLVAHALHNNEPVLLVGETGCGKTTVCQMLADALGKDLHIVNAHQNTETGDLIGAQRPVRNRAAILEQLKQDLAQAFNVLGKDTGANHDIDVLLPAYRSIPASELSQIPEELRHRIESNQTKSKALFEWSDGSLVQAMKEGQLFLLDEISLADDSVLERLNSVLEPQRTILLAEKGVDNSFIQAADGFQFFATMNPGGDYGKRELSPALRNRFTEIWVPSLSEHGDVLQIVEAKLQDPLKTFADAMVHFAEWFGQNYRSSSSASISVRDVLAWVNFMNGCSFDPYLAVLHGAAMVYIDTLGANPSALLAINPESIQAERAKCLEELSNLLRQDISPMYYRPVPLFNTDDKLSIGDFSIGKRAGSDDDHGFAFDAPTTKLNGMRVLRALQVQKPILIEGSPGVGKTTLISALARACNMALTRINLSEQTDLMDLFGSDVPMEGAEAGHFAWRDAPFLQAMQRGEWVLLDEMNLASQSVLEGLNACLDHRGEVYISELDQTFKRHPNFTVFAAQNPHHQGGGRKGLPSSFVNRFSVVYADVFRDEDIQLICRHSFPDTPQEVLTKIAIFVEQVEQEVVHKRKFGSQGGPWEFNLRDILRWLQLLSSSAPLLAAATPSYFFNLIFRQRFRSARDRLDIDKIFATVFGVDTPSHHLFFNISPAAYQVGVAYMQRDPLLQRLQFPTFNPTNRLAEVESVMICIQQNLPCILAGPSGSGKTTLIQHVAAASGKSLIVFPLNADIDTMDLVGGFEQVDPQRAASAFLQQLTDFLSKMILASLPAEVPEEAMAVLGLLKDANASSPSYFSSLSLHLDTLETKTSLAEFGNLANICQKFANSSMALENARFEWVDGVLVKALEQGDWLVLDNANLCSSSVLDRLNSLLEPNGVMSINEHCGPDGEPKVVRPHPEFRIFLTMDPRFGELSRAMRNRAIEIFLEPLPADVHTHLSISRSEAALQRYQAISRALDTDTSTLNETTWLYQVALDNLAWADMAMLSRFVEQSQRLSLADPKFLATCQNYLQLYQSTDNHDVREAIGNMLNKVAQKTTLAPGFRDAQIIHPLQNSPLVPLLQQSSGPTTGYWLAACVEFTIEITNAMNAQSGQASGIETLKPSKMNRLQRSLVRGRVAATAKDSTTNIDAFLTALLLRLKGFLHSSLHSDNDGQWKMHKKAVSSLLQYWWDTYHLATSTTFEEATFQAHLAIGTDILKGLSKHAALHTGQESIAREVLESLKTNFSSGFQLTTGLSMEVLWRHLRPAVIPNCQVMETLDQMQRLAQLFDTLKWKTSISIRELGGIMKSLIKAYRLVLTPDIDGRSLVQSLSTELENLEISIGKEESGISPFLASQFEVLRQSNTLELLRSGRSEDFDVDVDTVVLANHPTAPQLRLSTSTESSLLLQSVDDLLGSAGNLEAILGTYPASLLQKLHGIESVGMKSLKLLESELPSMGNSLAKSSATLCRAQLLDLNVILSRLISEAISAHGENFGREYEAWSNTISATTDLESLGLPRINETVARQQQSIVVAPDIPQHLREVISNNFVGASVAAVAARSHIENCLEFSAMAWVQFAIGCITLYVPNRSFDPDKRQRLERKRHQETRDILDDKISALRQFERLFTGQESNLRIQLLETEIKEYGEPPAILQEVYRPQHSELDQLQGEFNNLLKIVTRSQIPATLLAYFQKKNENNLQEIRLVQSNVTQIIRRLSERFRAYNDITAPVISMLRSMQIGLSLAALASVQPSSNSRVSAELMAMTPFLGGGPMLAKKNIISDHPLEYMALATADVAAERLTSFSPQQRELLLEAFHGCYDQWTKRLESDRLEAESKTGLYRFKGSAEDEEEEDAEQFNELFPAYDDESNGERNVNVTSTTARDTAVSISRVHEKIFLGGITPSESILSLIRHMSGRIAILHDGPRFGGHNMTAAILPGSMLLLDDHTNALTATTTIPESYNFYTDAHLPETRKLVTLIHQVQDRFHELQRVDEIGHMQPLEDVLVSCRELLEFHHTEPLAKIITKVEKIHTFMHEWQFGGWASRANTALTLYDNLTATIVSWRRLELSTWAKLFDMESKKCEDDARSWWFVAYQVVIAAPLQVSENIEELKNYAQKLLQDLEVYFTTAILGQFAQRLQLLKQLQKHLQLLIQDVPSMSIIHGALSNFISLYARYEKPVNENLKRGRVSLEKAMRDVLLLASWKDTNIVALRDSAKRSHHKLFKIIRKFRALLGQPMEFVIKQGIPDESPAELQDPDHARPVLKPTVDQSALALCTELVPNWSQRSKRFVNVSMTVNRMAITCQIPKSAVDGPSYLDAVLGNIISSTAELQKATPSILSEETKDTVKHLKSRKRKLFADTLKELRQMGIKHNLSADALRKQESLSTSLANLEGSTSDVDVPGLEYYFHKSIDLAPRSREAARQPSEDLSSAEVARSSGFLEGILQLLLSQHNVISANTARMSKLEGLIAMAAGLWAPDKYEVQLPKYSSNHEKVLRWLPHILSVALDLVAIHSKLAKLDSRDLRDSITSWKDRFAELLRNLESLSPLPPDVVSTQRSELEDTITTTTQELRLDLTRMTNERPDLAFILNQIIPWSEVISSQTTSASPEKTISDMDSQLSNTCDSILVGTEKYKTAIDSLPASTEDPAWLARNDSSLATSIKSLHCENVIALLDKSFQTLTQLDLEDSSIRKAASAIFAVAVPIFQQYLSTLQQGLKRYAQLHRATCKMYYVLSKTFIQIATQGFCTPSEKSAGEDGTSEKLEGGTGLGEGEGAEDISKDIQDDENLDELAQEPNEGEKGEMENEQDAVDMADADMEGEMGEGEEKGSDDEDGEGESGDDMDEEAGDVDDLDPTAVDEKMWDGDGEEAEKDQEGDDSKGKKDKDENAAAQDNGKQADEGDEGNEEEVEEEVAGAEQGEEIKQDETEKHDPHAQEGEALDLPDDMELDGDNEEKSEQGSDDGMGDLSDVEQNENDDDVANDGQEEEGAENMDGQEDQDIGSDMDVVDLDEDTKDEGEETGEAGEKADDEPVEQDEEQGLLRDNTDDANMDADNAAPSDVQGSGEAQEETSIENKAESASKAQRDDGGQGGDSSEQRDAAAEDGEQARQANGEAPQDSRDDTQDTSAAQPFKKLGEALERWHQQQSKIREHAEQKEEAPDQQVDINAESLEFQHLQDEDAQADTQALGTATEEQAHALDESMAIDSESKDMPDQFQPDEVEKSDVEIDDVMDVEEPSTPEDQNTSDAYEGRAGAMIKQAQEKPNESLDDRPTQPQQEFEEDVEDVDNQLESTHLDETSALQTRSAADVRQQWTEYESLTRDLSLSLTEQLRLILAPTLATKMRGDFRTGKRLNIKRIIPYIASQYKRDKIWMRRSVPSKRSYQIMLAVDNSKSMGESGSGSLALETLVMVSKSLSMLEVGEICVVGFGDQVKVAHEFETPFSSDAGPRILQDFAFNESRTDVTRLVRDSIELFRAARTKASGSPADLWQMELIISDGVCDSSEHEPIRRLLREALEERIMMVFVVVDDVRTKKKGESVMDLKEAKFVKDENTGASNVKIERYLDTFPFQYYLIVSDVKELPGVLATLLRQWFAEVADSSS